MAPHEASSMFSSTTTYSKMYLSDSPINKNSPADSSDKMKTEGLASACCSTSMELQYRLSIVSDLSNPGLDDPFASSASDDSSKDHDDGSDGEALEHAAAQLWDSWWSPVKQSLDFDQVTPRSTHGKLTQSLSPINRNFASANLSDLTLSDEPLPTLQRSFAIRNARHRRRSQTNLPNDQSPKAYIAFPPQPPPVAPKPQDYRFSPPGRYNSWPARSSSRQMSRPPLQRARANTTPGNSYAPVHNSSLSICTTLSPTSQGSRHTSPSTTLSEDQLYMRSSLCTPNEPPKSLMDLMSNEISPEVSCFEFDDDDNEELSLIDSLGSKLHIRTSSGSHTRDKEVDCEEKGKKSLKIRSKARSASVALMKCAFKIRKRGGTVGSTTREPLDV
jgi:hypothetical protein